MWSWSSRASSPKWSLFLESRGLRLGGKIWAMKSVFNEVGCRHSAQSRFFKNPPIINIICHSRWLNIINFVSCSSSGSLLFFIEEFWCCFFRNLICYRIFGYSYFSISTRILMFHPLIHDIITWPPSKSGAPSEWSKNLKSIWVRICMSVRAWKTNLLFTKSNKNLLGKPGASGGFYVSNSWLFVDTILWGRYGANFIVIFSLFLSLICQFPLETTLFIA
jgi:hypothetical protein